jgi:DNA-binding transcriptional MocR family regulator
VQESGAVPTQRELADELNVPRSRVQRAIDRNRDEWEQLRRRVQRTPQTASVGGGSGDR